MRINPVKARIAAGKKCLGAWLAANNTIIAEVLAQQGYDFLLIDHEHSPGDLPTALNQLQAIRSGGNGDAAPAPMMRVPWNDFVYIKRALDIGMEGLMIPNVETAEQGRAAIAATRYPPDGMRGLAFGVTRHSGYGGDAADTWAKANREVFVMLQIETPKAVAAIPELAKIPGVDMLFIGPNDLMSNAGENPLKPSAAGLKLLAEAERAILASGVPMGSILHSGHGFQQMFANGYALVIAGSDISILRTHAAGVVAEHRKHNG